MKCFKVCSLTVCLLVVTLCVFPALLIAQGNGNGNGNGGGNGGGSGGGAGGNSPSYMVVDLGGPLARADAVNDLGEVIGTLDRHATYWQVDEVGNVQTVSLPEPSGGLESYAEDINNLGEAVGLTHGQDTNGNFFTVATLWRIANTTVTLVELPPLPGDEFSYAEAISDTGLIVGTSQATNGNGAAVVWQVDAQNQVHIFQIGSVNSISSSTDDVNNLGQVVGYDRTLGNVVWTLEFDATGLVNGVSSTSVLPNPLGGIGTNIGSIKDYGFVTGEADLAVTGKESHAVIWEVDTDGNVVNTTDLGVLSGKDLAGAADVNSFGNAVGNSCKMSNGPAFPNIVCTPCLWQNGVILDLNSLLTDKGGLKKLTGAFSINESGWICGEGEKSRTNHAYVAIPLQ